MSEIQKKIIWKFICIIMPSALLFVVSCNLDSCNDGGMPDVESHYINRVYTVNTDGSGLKQIITGGDYSLLSNNKIIYLNNNKLYLCNSDGSDSTIISPINLNVNAYNLFMKESRIQLNRSSYPGNYISIINLDGSGLTHLNIPGNNNGIVLSPDGQKIAFTNNSGFYIMNIDGSDQRQIKDTTNRSYCYDISFTPDGNNVIYIHDIQYGVALDLRLYNIQSAVDTSLFYNDDGNKVIAYSTSKWNKLLFSNGDGVSLLNLNDYHYNFLHRGGDASFSFDSTKITFWALNSNYDFDAIYIMDLTRNSMNKIKINLPKTFIHNPILSLDGKQIFFEADTSWQVIHKVNTNDNVVY